jgi:glutathione S-transferase
VVNLPGPRVIELSVRNIPLKLYYSPQACSLAPHIALEETGLPFELCLTELATGAQRRPDYLSINPKGRVPALVDGNFIVTECPAVLLYIARRYPKSRLWPSDAQEEARCAEWLAWCASGLHEAFGHMRRPERFADSDTARIEVSDKGRATTRRVWEQVEQKLVASSSSWAAGEHYSVADACLLTFWVWGRADKLRYEMAEDFPAWTRHARKMAERSAVQRAFKREGIDLPITSGS